MFGLFSHLLSAGISRSIRRILTLALAAAMTYSVSHGEGFIGPGLSRVLSDRPAGTLKVWIFFTDKGTDRVASSSPVSPRSLARRGRTSGGIPHLESSDYPVYQPYVDEIIRDVLSVRQRSRWFNGISAVIRPEQIPLVRRHPFVREIELVRAYRNDRISGPAQENPPKATSVEPATDTTPIDYGPSFSQLEQINIPAVHSTGNYGQGVLVGVFDNGFRLLNHEAFDSLQIVATHDFVDKKESVIPNNPSLSFGSHGVNTLSVLGGYMPGQLIGAAFGASYLLARTENDSSETPLEEDNWVAAIEWADSIGVDVTSTSLIYREYNPPYTGWTWEDMDGNTTMITRAADMAVAKGIVVVNSAGNFGDALVPGENTLGAPADGDSVITVGAVDSAGTRAAFSSVGPTTSSPPRTKPDIMARGVAVRAASAADTVGYVNSFQGTSAACPLAAGAAALILSAVPDASPFDIANAMRQTAGNSGSPNNRTGWGIVNALAAINYLTMPPPVAESFDLFQNYPNPFNSSTTIQFDLTESSTVGLEVFNVLGQRIRVLFSGSLEAGRHVRQWDGRNGNGTPVGSGVYIYRITASNATGTFMTDRPAVLIR